MFVAASRGMSRTWLLWTFGTSKNEQSWHKSWAFSNDLSPHYHRFTVTESSTIFPLCYFKICWHSRTCFSQRVFLLLGFSAQAQNTQTVYSTLKDFSRIKSTNLRWKNFKLYHYFTNNLQIAWWLHPNGIWINPKPLKIGLLSESLSGVNPKSWFELFPNA